MTPFDQAVQTLRQRVLTAIDEFVSEITGPPKEAPLLEFIKRYVADKEREQKVLPFVKGD